MKECCKNCKWWVKMNFPEDAGKCKRMPPTAFERVSMFGAFPTVRVDDWCGEYTLKGEKDD